MDRLFANALVTALIAAVWAYFGFGLNLGVAGVMALIVGQATVFFGGLIGAWREKFKKVH